MPLTILIECVQFCTEVLVVVPIELDYFMLRGAICCTNNRVCQIIRLIVSTWLVVFVNLTIFILIIIICFTIGVIWLISCPLSFVVILMSISIFRSRLRRHDRTIVVLVFISHPVIEHLITVLVMFLRANILIWLADRISFRKLICVIVYIILTVACW